VLSDLYVHDAIVNFTSRIAEWTKVKNIPSTIFTERHSQSISVDGNYSDFFRRVQADDVLLFHLPHEEPYLSKFMSLPCRKVVYYHNITPGSFFRPYDPVLANMLDRGRASLPLLAKADAVFAASNWSLAEVLPFLRPEAKYGVLPPFTEDMLSPLTLSPIDETPLFPPKSYLITVGRLVPHKNQVWGIRMFAELHKMLPDLSYLIVGSGIDSYEKELRLLASGLGEAASKIHFIGTVNDNKAASLFSNAAGLLCCSLHEGFCAPLVEAMVYGVPIFALSQPAVCETLGNSGVILDADDYKNAAEQIRAVLTEDQLSSTILQKKQQQLDKLKTKCKYSNFWVFINPNYSF
jgi:glycosyltransferase involved in cell wall biosynthesis